MNQDNFLRFFILKNEVQRAKILRVILKNEDLDEDVQMEDLASRSVDFSGSDLKELCRCAAMNSFLRHVKDQKLDKTAENEIENQIKIFKVDFDVAFAKLQVKNLTKNENTFNFNF
jgi:SpoVK/Ycf46/Vps4 family AAA+-type ATPase